MSRDVVISKEVRNISFKLRGKEQTYDDIITELIQANGALKQSSVGSAKPTKQESA